LKLAQYGDGARRLRRFNGQKPETRGTSSPLTFFTLMRRKRRAPLAPDSCRSILQWQTKPVFVSFQDSRVTILARNKTGVG